MIPIKSRRKSAGHANGGFETATWDNVSWSSNVSFSLGNTKITGAVGYHWGYSVSNKLITQSIYVEVTIVGFSCYGGNPIFSKVGIGTQGDFADTTPSTMGSLYAANFGTMTVVGISYNPTTGQYKIKNSSGVLASGYIAANVFTNKIFGQTGYCDQSPGSMTLNAGMSPFVLTPEYL